MPENFQAMDLTKARHKVIEKCAAVNRSEKAGHDKEYLGRLSELRSDASLIQLRGSTKICSVGSAHARFYGGVARGNSC